MTIRAVRNNNPGNMERSRTIWRGEITRPELMTAEQRKETRFIVFHAPLWGFRAMAKTLRTYGLHSFNSVTKIIGRWAPSSENNTTAYVRHVCDAIGAEPDQMLDMKDRAVITALCRAIAVHESGGWFFETADLDEGVKLAFA